jgi:hypothetical protein
MKWSEKTNLCGNYCDLIVRKPKIFKSCQWGECCGRNWNDWISFKIQPNKTWRKLWWKLTQFVIVNTQFIQMKKWWDIIRNCVNWLHDKLRNWSWVSLLIWFEMCVIWFELRFKYVRFERQLNSDGMKESLLSFNERCFSFVIIHTSDGIISMLNLCNFNTSSLIQFFIFNGNLLIFVVPLNLNSLKFVKCSNSVGILLRNAHPSKLRMCNWVSNPICVGSDVIPPHESERCWSDVSWEICDGSVSSCCVPIQFQHLKWRKLTHNWDQCVTLYLCIIEWEMKKWC